ncbi:IS3 family transposase [Spiroplasma sp. SV19]|uniref:IS3 family transposase n=1 Tax=Spiroplasma sp. SV19 TaxID=2570468 RepID=UPI0024B80AE4|nr:IS3 family transposase [Spiroplasma sp. SV19]WHQ37310.1 IS3 family transposase [Spiroplasma sp. SV19]
MQYYHHDFIKYANKNNFKLSKKKSYKLGHNALSENTFYHLTVEWLSYNKYETINQAINGIKEYVKFYNYERIHSQWDHSPMSLIIK